MRWPRRSLPLFLSLLVAAVAPEATPAFAQNSDVDARLRADISSLTAFPSRVPGTPGNTAAAALVESRFKQIGLQNVRSDSTFVTAPVTKSSSLAIGGRQLEVLPLYPNHVVARPRPPPAFRGQSFMAVWVGPRISTGRPLKAPSWRSI
jgi:hypothetical protein